MAIQKVNYTPRQKTSYKNILRPKPNFHILVVGYLINWEPLVKFKYTKK